VNSRLRAGFDEAGWVDEQLSGVANLVFLRDLVRQIETDWPRVLQNLEEILSLLLNRQTCVCNLTCNAADFDRLRPQLENLLQQIPSSAIEFSSWDTAGFEGNEGLTLPAQVNYVGKGAPLYDLGYTLDGSIHVILGHLQYTYLWDKIRVRGGAYGAFSNFDPLSGGFTLLSYRDPNLSETLDTYDAVGSFLAKLQLDDRELTKAIISTIGRREPYRLPDAQGFTAMARHLTGVTDEYRQITRDQILSTTAQEFNTLGELLAEVAQQGRVVILGSKERLEDANRQHGGGWLEIKPVL